MHTKTSIGLGGTLAAALLLLAAPLQAEDIDIYSGTAGADSLPNVLIVLDSSANWSASIGGGNCYYNENGVKQIGDGPKATSPNKEQGTKMAIEKCALHNLVDALPTKSDGTAYYNVGLMLFNESPAAISGGYPRIAIKPLDSSTKAAFKLAIRNIAIGSDKGNNAAFSKSLYEAYKYLRNDTPYVGNRGSKWDPAAFLDGRYVTPSPNTCGRNYVIFIANGSPGEVTNNDAKALLQQAGGNTTQITYPTSYIGNSDQANWADEFTRFMSGADVSSKEGTQSIIVHTIAVTGASSDGNYPNFIGAMATQGRGQFKSASDESALTLALQDLFNNIQAASSVFSAASLPISVTSRGTYSNHVFMGMFVPDGQSRPRWMGNLKQYEFAYDQINRTLSLVDSEGNPAINSGTGFIASGAISHWTQASSYWLNAPAGTPASASDRPDGEVVYKGAAAQRLRESILDSQASRNVFTCISCASGTELAKASVAATKFTSSNAAITAAALGVAEGERSIFIDWIRGTDNAGDESGPGGTVTVRPSVHGDVLHSRPAVVDYGGDIGIVVFYGANDGMLHAVAGNKEDNGFSAAGATLWSFLPEEQFAKFKRLRANSPLVKFPSTLAPTALPRDYFVDGPISIYQKLDSGGNTTQVQLFVAMRRGGRALYAFDVTVPDKPVYLWRKTQADIPVLGQTWSEPKVARIKGHANPVLIMGAGYDPTEDLASPAAPTMGNAVLVLDSLDGSVVHAFTGIDRPVPADVTLLDTDYDGYVDRAYAVDLGGNIYRLDFEQVDAETNSATAAWQLHKLAALGASGGKKFFYPPDVVLTKGFAIVLAGTGDREKPLAANTQDYFFTLIDRNLGKGIDDDAFDTVSWGESGLVTPQNFDSSLTQNGCYSALAPGEKVVNAPVTIAGRTYFSTNQPQTSTNSCAANLGLATSYAVPLLCKQPIATELVGGGLPPSPVAGVVEVPYVNPQTGATEIKHVPFIIGGDALSVDADGDGQNDNTSSRCNQALGPCEPNPTVAPKRTKIFWHTETER